ncbi:MAG: flagella cluster protein [Salinigranum sp.]
MSERLDIHAVRHRMKLVRDTGDTTLYENRDGVACPACGSPFDELLVTKQRENSFAPNRPVAFCVIREEDRLLFCTHLD